MAKKNDEMVAREQALTEREAALNEREEALQGEESLLDERANTLDEREKALNEEEKILARGNVVMPEEKKELTNADKKLIAKACDAYGIADKFVVTAGVDKSGDAPVAVVVTHGGKKVRYETGDEKTEDFCSLTDIEVDGVVRKKPRHVAGKKKK